MKDRRYFGWWWGHISLHCTNHRQTREGQWWWGHILTNEFEAGFINICVFLPSLFLSLKY
jgi:hypothetical protein